MDKFSWFTFSKEVTSDGSGKIHVLFRSDNNETFGKYYSADNITEFGAWG